MAPFPNIQCDCGLTAGCPKCNPGVSYSPILPGGPPSFCQGCKDSAVRLQELEAKLQAARETLEPLIVRLDEVDQAKQIDKHIGLTPDDWTTWVLVGDLRRAKAGYEDKD